MLGVPQVGQALEAVPAAILPSVRQPRLHQLAVVVEVLPQLNKPARTVVLAVAVVELVAPVMLAVLETKADTHHQKEITVAQASHQRQITVAAVAVALVALDLLEHQPLVAMEAAQVRHPFLALLFTTQAVAVEVLTTAELLD